MNFLDVAVPIVKEEESFITNPIVIGSIIVLMVLITIAVIIEHKKGKK